MRRDPIWEYFNAMKDRRVGEIPLDDLVAVIRGNGMDRPIDASSRGVPDLLGPNTPKEVDGNWGRQAIIKYNPSTTEVDAGFMVQAPLLSLNGANRRPCSITIDVFPSFASPGTSSFPAGEDSTGNLLSYRSRAVLSYGVSYGLTGFRSDQIYFDIGRGQRVKVVANMLFLSALMLAPPTGYISGSMNVGAVMCVNDASTYAPPIVTELVDALAAGGSTDIIIPPRCNFLNLVQSGPAALDLQLDFKDNADGDLFSLAFTAGEQITPIPLCDAYKVTLTYTGSIPATGNFRLPFQLSN